MADHEALSAGERGCGVGIIIIIWGEESLCVVCVLSEAV